MESSPSRRRDTDAPSAIAAASCLSGLNLLLSNLQPIMLGALADSAGFSDAALGQASASFIGFNTLCIISSPLWIRRANWRSLVLVGISLGTIGLIAGIWATTLPFVLALLAILGVVKGLVGAPAFASLGDSSNPDRTYGIALIFQSALAALAAVPLSAWIIPQFGAAGFFVTVALLFCTGIPLSRWLPSAGREARSDIPSSSTSILSGAAIPPLIMLVATGLFVAGALGFWFFAERIGTARGVPPALIGATVSISACMTIAAAALVAWLGARVSSQAYIIGGALVLLTGMSLLHFDGNASFMASVGVFSLGYGLAQPGYWALSRKVDATGRLFTATPAAGGIAGVCIGLAAGSLIGNGGYDALIMACSLCVGAGAALAVAATAIAKCGPILRRRTGPRHSPGGSAAARGR